MRGKLLTCALLTLMLAAQGGCAEVSRMTGATWHQKFGWNAEEYFDDPQVVALCKAIEANDLEEIDRLVVAGADVNAQGKGKMTPLLWAYPDNKLERFKRLLEHGADPNVIIESDFNTRGGMSPGDSVTHMAAATWFPGYFEAVFENGGNPNLTKSGEGHLNDTPIFSVIKFGSANKKKNIQMLIEKGADLDHMNDAWQTPVMQAVSWGRQYDIALILLRAGADHKIYKPKHNSRVVHIVVEHERLSESWTPQQFSDYHELVKWLEDRGESIEEARADLERWKSWNHASGEYRRKMDAEIAEREAREARENAPGEEPGRGEQ